MQRQAVHHIERREFKYHVPEVLVPRIRAALTPFCRLDPFAARQRGGFYRIDSLYFDTPRLDLYHANEHEQRDRYKLRVRRYPDAPGTPVFFETKRRFHDVIVKSRGRVDVRHWQSLLGPDPPPLADVVDDADIGPVGELVGRVRKHDARPLVLVRYEREPWIGLHERYVRVTFDRRVRCQRARGLSFETDGGAWRASDTAELQGGLESCTILELKFIAAEVPLWLSGLVQRFDLTRRAFSKYGASVRATWELQPIARSPRPSRHLALER